MKLASIDIHSHLLPGVDDGFRSASASLSAIKTMAANGCRYLVLTPHMNPDVYPDTNESMFKSVYDELVSKIPSEWNIKTALAAEYMVVGGFEKRIASSPNNLLAFPDGSILIEMSYCYRSVNLENTIFELNMAGFKPILAHPERYLYMSRSLSDFDRLQDMGCRFQMNFLSATGAYGPDSIRILRYLLQKGMYSFVASDLHSQNQLEAILSYRPGFFKRILLKGLDDLVDKLNCSL